MQEKKDSMRNRTDGQRGIRGKKGSKLRAILATILITCVIGGCGSSKSALYESAAGAAPAAVAEDYAYDTAAYDGGAVMKNGVAGMTSYQCETAEAAAEEPIANESGYEQETTAASGRKLIKTVNISAETEDFDELVPNLQKQVETLGGYIENISVYDVNSYYIEDLQVKQRCANLTARVPKEKLDGFLTQVGEQTNVTSRSENVEDVTLQYVDLESHKKALLTEQERLLTLLGQAENVEDIIAIEGRLSEVRYQLESMESQLRTYDNQIDYSTVYLNIEEVRKYSAPQTATAWERIERGFMKSLEDIGFGIRNLAISFVIDIPYFVLWLILIAVAVIVFRVVRKLWRKRRARKAARDEDAAQRLRNEIRDHWPDKILTVQDKPKTREVGKQTGEDNSAASGDGSGQDADQK